MAENIQITLNSSEGVRLLVQDKYIEQNIDIIPVLKEQTVTPTTEEQVIEANGAVGLSVVTVNPIPANFEIPVYFDDENDIVFSTVDNEEATVTVILNTAESASAIFRSSPRASPKS